MSGNIVNKAGATLISLYLQNNTESDLLGALDACTFGFATDTHRLVLDAGAASYRLPTIDSADDMAIPLSISHYGDADTYLTFDSANNFGLFCGDVQMIDASGGSAVGKVTIGNGADYVDFDVYNGTLFVDASAGRVGIGIEVPQAKLHICQNLNGALCSRTENVSSGGSALVYFEAKADLEYLQLLAGSSNLGGTTAGVSNTNVAMLYAHGGGALLIDNSDNTPMHFATNDIVRMTILGTGLVGIGTTTPSAKLAINGGLHVGGDTDPGDNNLLVDGTIAGSFAAYGSAAATFVISDSGTLKTRTAAQTRSDIGAMTAEAWVDGWAAADWHGDEAHRTGSLRYLLQGKICYVTLDYAGHKDGTGNGFYFTTPYPPVGTDVEVFVVGTIGSWAKPSGIATISSSGGGLLVVIAPNGASWSGGEALDFRLEFFYEIA